MQNKNYTSGLVLDSLTFSYGKAVNHATIKDFTLHIPTGQLVVMTGKSGCGKSTICSLAAGILPHHAGYLHKGNIYFQGQDVSALPLAKRSRQISMMFQNPDLQFCMDTVEHEILFCLENLATPRSEMKQKLEDALNFVGITHLRKRQLHTLSGGEKQKAMLACIVAMESRCIVLDEPFANIDSAAAAEILKKLHTLQQEKGTTILVADHNVNPYLPYAHQIVVLSEKGSIVWQESLIESTDSVQAKLQSFGLAFSSYTPLEKKHEVQERRPLLQTKDLSIQYTTGKQSKTILSDINLTFYQNTITTITGRSGSGKSTLFHALAGMLPYRGSVFFAGKKLRAWNKRKATQQIGVIFQNPQDQFLANSVYEEMQASFPDPSQDSAKQKIMHYLQELDLWEHRDHSPYTLSEGQQRRLAVGVLLAYPCQLLLCDEPTYGQDRQSTQIIMDFIQRRVLEDNLTVIFSTHDLLLAEQYSDFHYICQNGTVVASKRKEALPC